MTFPHIRPVLIALIAPVFLSAQTTSSGPTSAAPEPDSDVISLSPFTVNSSTDSGYRATSTLAGSRVKTDLKDIAASVTVLTNDFMDDLGATDLAGALGLIAGAENDQTTDPTALNSLNQGYLGGDFGDTNTRDGEVRVRGLGRASTAANYIQVIASPDRYNIDRAEFLRGANSILFGLAEPAGMINYSTKVANLNRDLGKVELKVDNFGSTREVVDFSRVVLKDKLALRVAALNSDKRYPVDLAFLRDKRLFLTSTYKPFQNTTLRAFGEFTDSSGRRPNYRTAQDNVTGWLNLYNQYAKVLTPAQLASAFYWDPTVLTSTGTPTNSVVTANGQTLDLGLLRRGMDGNVNGTALFFSNTDWNNPIDGTATIFGTRSSTGAAVNGAFRQMFVRSADPTENTSGFNDPQVTNSSILPYRTFEIGVLPGNYRWEKGRKFNLTLDQKITDDLYVSAAYQVEDFREEQAFSPITQQQQVSIDINTKLPDGRTNPNFLRPFIYGRNIGDFNNQTVQNVLVQANYDFDFAKKTSRLDWLGFHRLTGIYTKTSADRLTYRWNQQTDSVIPGIYAPTGGIANNGSRHVYQLWYIGDPVKVGDTGLNLTGFPTNTYADAERAVKYTYYDSVSRTWKQSPQSVNITKLVIPGGRSYTSQENEGAGVSLQSFFWKKKIVTLVGYRKDSVEQYTPTLVSTAEPLTGTIRSDYQTSKSPQFSISSPTSTVSIVFHATDWLSLFASRSENFAATSPRHDSLFRPIAPQNGKTDEFGLNFDLLNNKLSLRLSAFKSSQNLANSAGASSTASLRIETVEDQIYTALESTGRLGEWTTIGANGPTNAQYDRPLDIAATEDSISKGIQAEVFYQPTSALRFAFNVSKLDNTSSNVGREVKDFLDYRADFYRKYFNQGLRTDGTTNANPSSATLIRDNFISAVLANYVGNVVREGTSNPGVSEYVFKLVGSYSFRDGRFKGFSVGGNASYETGKIMGYGQTSTTFNAGGVDNYAGMISDPNQPFLRNTPIYGGVFARYSRKIMNGKVKWTAQLNAQNLFGEHGLRIIAVDPDRSPVFGVAQSRTYELSNSFEF